MRVEVPSQAVGSADENVYLSRIILTVRYRVGKLIYRKTGYRFTVRRLLGGLIAGARFGDYLSLCNQVDADGSVGSPVGVAGAVG